MRRAIAFLFALSSELFVGGMIDGELPSGVAAQEVDAIIADMCDVCHAIGEVDKVACCHIFFFCTGRIERSQFIFGRNDGVAKRIEQQLS